MFIMNKTIQFNSDFLSSVSKKKSNGTRKKEKEKPNLSDKNNSKVLRQKLLERIKEYQNKTTDQKNESSAIESSNQPIDNTFNNSLEILKGLSSGIGGHNKTVKHRPTSSDVSIEMPDFFKEESQANHSINKSINVKDTINKDKDITNGTDTAETTEQDTILDNESGRIIIKDQPPYSSIKNGSRPTYKEMLKSSELPKSVNSMPDTIGDTIGDTTEPVTETNAIPRASLKGTEEIKEQVMTKRPQPPRKRMITKTYKYILGKNGRNVSVLLKDSKTRKMVKKECYQLSNTPIHEIKQYLRKKNLLKIGSNATDDVIKKIYEQAILTGEVRNMSKDTLIHNFMKT